VPRRICVGGRGAVAGVTDPGRRMTPPARPPRLPLFPLTLDM
jgi:hypothetical protein